MCRRNEELTGLKSQWERNEEFTGRVQGNKEVSSDQTSKKLNCIALRFQVEEK
jgi:hypothetical protein